MQTTRTSKLKRRDALMLGGSALALATLRAPLDAPIPMHLPPLANGLRVMTWNVVHGTRISIPTRLAPRTFVEARLQRVADIANAMSVDALALQEADGDSRFDRTGWLSQRCGLRPTVSADGARHGATLAIRTGSLSTLHQAFSSGALDPKGLSLVRVWSPIGEIDVASVHLHAFAPSLRRSQIEELTMVIGDWRAQRGYRPLILAGDLNDDADGTTAALMEGLDLHTADRTTPTFTDLGFSSRLDWVLVSSELRIDAHRVMDAGTSDHRAIVADIVLREAV